jgi:phosphatidylserine/phosphatidylglycerophosphate/cardiolipin synthase-like enzyme
VDLSIAVSEACADSYAAADWRPPVVYEAAPMPDEPASLRSEPEPFTIGTVGVISRRKGSDLFVSAAERLVYLESQFLWSPELVDLLEAKLRQPPSDDFRIVVVLPSHPDSGADDSRGQVGRLVAADRGAGRFLACALFARDGQRRTPIYVHAKIGIVDDRWLTLGSANLNEHSLFNDTEVNIVTCEAALARQTRERLWAEHLERPLDEVRGRDPRELVDEAWKPTAVEQRRRRERGEALTHRLVELPGVSRRSRRLGGPLTGLVVDG